jgi:hypothetical protein
LQLATENVNRKSLAWMRDRLGQMLNMLAKFADAVTAVVISAGTD